MEITGKLDPKDPQPGAYRDVPEAVYFALPALNASTLKLMGRSPAHCAAYLAAQADADHDAAPTAAQYIGRALHAAVLEPDRFPIDFMCEPQPQDHGAMVSQDHYKAAAKLLGLKVSGTKAALKAAILEADPAARFWDDMLPTFTAGRVVLKPHEWAMCEAVMASVKGNPRAAKSFSGGENELTLIWHDKRTGALCKARLDYYRPDLGIVFDLKSTIDAREHPVQRDIEKYSYHVSAAHYMNGLLALNMPAVGFSWVFVEKTAPYAQGLYFAADDMLATGRDLIAYYLADYTECAASDQWPAYDGAFHTIDLPVWAQQ